MNFDKWKSNTANNILYITGLSGSGKTTLGEEYEKKYHAKLFEIDQIECDYDSSGSDLLQRAKEKFPDYTEHLKNKFNDITFVQCKGHTDNEGNNRADELANYAMDNIK
jgi:dephospho-CoA kinase